MVRLSDLQAAKADLVEQGVARIAKVFSDEEVNRLRAAALVLMMESGRDRAYREGGRIQLVRKDGIEYPSILFWPCLASEPFDRVRCDRRMVTIVSHLIGDDAKQLNNQLYFKLPGSDDTFAWHQDIMFRADTSIYPGIEDRYIQTIIAIDPVTEKSGAIKFVLGSHKLGRLDLLPPDRAGFRTFRGEFSDDRLAQLPVKSIELEPGDMLVWSLLTVHGSGPNRAAASRMTYMNGFAAASASKIWPDYLKGAELQPVQRDAIPYA